MGVLPACISMHHMCAGVLRGQKKSDPLKLELQFVISHHVVLRIESDPLEARSVLLNTKSSLQAPTIIFTM